MIQVDLEATVADMTEADLEAVGDILDQFRAAITYDTRNGVLYLSATVDRMKMFMALDMALRAILTDRDRFPASLAYRLVTPA